MKKYIFIIVIFCIIILPSLIFCKQYSTTDSGKRVILNEDGTWEYIKVTKKEYKFNFRKAKWGMSIKQVKKNRR